MDIPSAGRLIRGFGQERRRHTARRDVMHPFTVRRQDLAVEERPDRPQKICGYFFIWLVRRAAAPPRSLPYFNKAACPPAA